MVRGIVLETSCAHTEVALADESGILLHRRLSASRKHARDLAPALKDLAAELGWSFASIDLVAVDIGPGSYTGLRVGIMTAKSLAYATKAAVVAVDSMTILAADAPVEAVLVCAIVDAQQGLVYSAELARLANGEQTFVRATQIGSAKEWAESLPEDAYVTGPAVSRFGGLVPANRRVAPPDCQSPTAKGLWSVAWRRYQAGIRDDFWTLEPLYLRSSSAEVKWDRRLAETELKGE